MEGRAEQLVAGADGEDDGPARDRAVEAAVGDEALGGERLRAVLAAADEVDVAVVGERLVGADLDALDRQPAQVGAAGQDEQVAAVAVGGQEVRVDPDQPQVALS